MAPAKFRHWISKNWEKYNYILPLFFPVPFFLSYSPNKVVTVPVTAAIRLLYCITTSKTLIWVECYLKKYFTTLVRIYRLSKSLALHFLSKMSSTMPCYSWMNIICKSIISLWFWRNVPITNRGFTIWDYIAITKQLQVIHKIHLCYSNLENFISNLRNIHPIVSINIRISWSHRIDNS